MAEEEGFLDRYTRIDELLAETIPLLQRLNAGDITVQMPPGEHGEEMLGQILEIEKQRMLNDFEILYFSYPADGTRQSVAAGTTVLDYWAGTIKAPDGAVTKMTTNLAKRNKEHLRSLAVNADRAIIIQMDEKDKAPVRADTWFVMTFQQFQKVKITCTATTNLFIFACTNPKHALEMQGESTVSVGREERNQVKSLIGTHFTGALAQYAAEEENLTGLDDSEITITSITAYSEQNLDMRVWLFETDGFQETTAADMDDDEFIESVHLDAPTDGHRYKNANGYYVAASDLNIDYEDLDASNELHVALEIVGATAKLASGSGGNVWLKFSYIPRT